MDDRRMHPKVMEDGKKDQQISQKGGKETQGKPQETEREKG